MKTRLLFAFAGLTALIISLAPACIADDSANLPTWKPDPKIVAGLGDDYVMYGSAIRMPGTFHLAKTDIDSKTDVRLWRGFPYGNGFQADFVTIAVPVPPDMDVTQADIQRVRDELLVVGKDILASEFSDWVQSTPQQGRVGSQTIDRVYFKAFDQRVLKEIHGFVYTTATSKCLYGFFAADIEPYNKLSLTTLESAVLTFHSTSAADTEIPKNVYNNWPKDPSDYNSGD